MKQKKKETYVRKRNVVIGFVNSCIAAGFLIFATTETCNRPPVWFALSGFFVILAFLRFFYRKQRPKKRRKLTDKEKEGKELAKRRMVGGVFIFFGAICLLGGVTIGLETLTLWILCAFLFFLYVSLMFMGRAIHLIKNGASISAAICFIVFMICLAAAIAPPIVLEKISPLEGAIGLLLFFVSTLCFWIGRHIVSENLPASPFSQAQPPASKPELKGNTKRVTRIAA